jgi:CubicO group peptidase (beta-lactamase class C family)
MPRDAIFNIASITKPVVAVGALMLQEEGRLSVYDPVARYLPELANREVAVATGAGSSGAPATEPAVRQPRVQDLMRHTSGFTAPPGWPRGMSADAFVDSVSRVPLDYQPGTRWEYGQGFDLLGIIVERLSQQSLGEFLTARVFTPLGMHDTGFQVPASKHSRYAIALPINPLTGQPQTVGDRRIPGGNECGDGCLASTAADYLRFAQMLLDGGTLGSTRILGPKTVEYMTSDHIGPDVDMSRLVRGWPYEEGYGFGLGVAVRRADGV